MKAGVAQRSGFSGFWRETRHVAKCGRLWTLPVPWAGFTNLPKAVDDAAELSGTIRYQRDLIRQYAKGVRFELVHEEVFLEVYPDRASDQMLEPLQTVKSICEEKNAVLLIVDFWQLNRWRDHGQLRNWLKEAGKKIKVCAIYPDTIMIGKKEFGPDVHFSNWRKKQLEWTLGKVQRKQKALARAQQLRADGKKNAQIAEVLNSEGLLSPTGRRWTEDNIGKLVNAASQT
jgi:hypothetical protein